MRPRRGDKPLRLSYQVSQISQQRLMPEFRQRVAFNLADPFAGQAELTADPLESKVDLLVGVGGDVSEAVHLPPWDRRMPRLEGVRELAD
jgi:hypothetical protein